LTPLHLPCYLYIKIIDIKILAIDHVVFNVADPERSLEFYAGRLGLRPERVEEYRSGNVPFPSVRVNAGTIIDFLPGRYSGAVAGGQNVNHVALTLVNTPDEIARFLNERGIEIHREMTGNFGARGDGAHAFHVMDPDGNVLELQAYE
jgi:catechol 2,3-dioxygenase-like lactoylglutathione lyase family enzyme